MLLDCGNGVFGKLRARCDYTDVDAVVISHLHADHFIDLIPYSYALLLTPRQQPVPVAGHPGTDEPARPRLVAPPGAKQMFRNVVGSLGRRRADRAGVRARGVRPGRRSRSARSASLRRGAALHPHPRGRGLVHGRRPVHLRRRLPALRGAGRVRARHRPAVRRGDPAAPRADRDPRPPDARRRPASTPGAPGPSASCSPTSPTSSTPSGRARRARGVRRRRSRSPARATSSRSDPSRCGGRRYALCACPDSATCWSTSSACGARWTSCSASLSPSSGRARRAPQSGFSPRVDVYYCGERAAGDRQGRAARRRHRLGRRSRSPAASW